MVTACKYREKERKRALFGIHVVNIAYALFIRTVHEAYE